MRRVRETRSHCMDETMRHTKVAGIAAFVWRTSPADSAWSSGEKDVSNLRVAQSEMTSINA